MLLATTGFRTIISHKGLSKTLIVSKPCLSSDAATEAPVYVKHALQHIEGLVRKHQTREKDEGEKWRRQEGLERTKELHNGKVEWRDGKGRERDE
jgi:hypothetical protein